MVLIKLHAHVCMNNDLIDIILPKYFLLLYEFRVEVDIWISSSLV